MSFSFICWNRSHFIQLIILFLCSINDRNQSSSYCQLFFLKDSYTYHCYRSLWELILIFITVIGLFGNCSSIHTRTRIAMPLRAHCLITKCCCMPSESVYYLQSFKKFSPQCLILLWVKLCVPLSSLHPKHLYAEALLPVRLYL